MKRNLFNFVSLLSLALFVATVALWTRSYWISDEVFLIYAVEGSEQLSFMQGEVLLKHRRPDLGVRGRPVRVSHRATSISALPPDVVPTGMGKTKWPGVRFVNNPALDPVVVRDALYPPKGLPPQTQFRLLMRRATVLNQLPTFWLAVAPMWQLAALFSLLPTLWLVGLVRRCYRRKKGICPACGYNLAGNASGVCPECGTAVPGKGQA